MMPRTISIVGSSNSRSPASARSPASIAYATEETGSAMTAKAKAKRRTLGRTTRGGLVGSW